MENKLIYAENKQKLELLAEKAGISNLKELRTLSEVPQREVLRLLHGLIPKMKLETLVKLAKTLKISIDELVSNFGVESTSIATQSENLDSINELKREYQLLQKQQENLYQDFQKSVLNTIESWLLQWPTAIAVAKQNPQLPASQLIPLVKPLENLLASWGVEAIAPVGTEIPYDPQWHQLMEGTAQPGELVKIRYVGYRQGEKLLYRAKVSPVSNN